jgi:predicted permease
MYAYYAGAEKQSIGAAMKKVLKNPIIWGIILAILFRQFHIALPQPIDRFSKNLADMASPLAFILLGTKLRRSSFSQDRALSAFVVVFKLLIMPMLFLPVAIFILGMYGNNLIPLFLFTAAPSAITTYQLAIQYEADDVLAGNLVMLTTLLSTISICVLVSILKSLSLI